MLFTARAHRQNERAAVIGTDASLKMLRLARARVGPYEDLRRVALLKANVLRTPFRPAAFDVVLCLHVAHVLADLEGLLGEMRRVLKPRGTLFLTSVVEVHHWRYLRFLFGRGVMAPPRRREDILAAIRAEFGTEPDSKAIGSMLFVRVR